MEQRSIEEMREIDRLLEELMDLPIAVRERKLKDIERSSNALVGVLRRLLAVCDDETVGAAPGGALAGSLVRRGLLGLDGEDDIAPGTRLGDYEIGELLGRGGMAEVYSAIRHYDGFEQYVALKIVRSSKVSENLRIRLRSEQRTLAKLDHPNIARFLDAGVSSDGTAYLAMERVRGRSIIHQDGATLESMVRMVVAVCDALEHAHAKLIVHCDIKPSNVLVDDEGRVRLLDFGIARLLEVNESSSSGLLFTVDYAAPEQITGDPITVATDVFQIGALLYRMVVGDSWVSFHKADISRLETVVVGVPIAPSEALSSSGCARYKAMRGGLARGLDAVILKCLRRAPEDRYGSIAELKQDLALWLELRPIPVANPLPITRIRLFLERNAKVVLVTACAATILAAISAVLLSRIAEERRVKRKEQERAAAIEGFLGNVFDQASPYLRDSAEDPLATLVRVGESMLQDERLDTASRLRLQGVLIKLDLDSGKLAAAEKRAVSAIAIAQSTPEAIPEDIWINLISLQGIALAQQDKVEPAIDVFKEASRRATDSGNRLLRATLNVRIGDMYRRLGKMPQAAEHIEPELEYLLSTSQELDRDFLDALLRAVLYLDQSGKGVAALAPIADRLSKAIPGQGREAVNASRLMLLSHVESNTGRHLPSAEHAGQAAALYRKLVGPEHPQVIKARAAACNSYRLAGDLALARRECIGALESLRKIGREISDDGNVIQLNLANIALRSGLFEDAKAILDNLGDTIDEKSAPYFYLNLALLTSRVAYFQGDREKALSAIHDAGRMQRKHFSGSGEVKATVELHRAKALLLNNAVDQAEATLDGIIVNDLEPAVRDSLLVEIDANRARVAARRGEYVKVQSLLSKVFETQAKVLDVAAIDKAWVLIDAGEIALILGQEDSAAQYFAQAAATGIDRSNHLGAWAWVQVRQAALTDTKPLPDAVANCRVQMARSASNICDAKLPAKDDL